MILYDLGSVSRRKKTPEGYLSVDARIARTGVQFYDAVKDFKLGELPDSIPREHGRVVRLLRPENEVFSPITLSSCANKPVTNGHPSETVSAENVRKWQVGFSRDHVKREGDMVSADLIVQDKAAINRIEQEGVNQISLGYTTDIDWTTGTDDLYGPYDGVQRNIQCNHIAIVKAGRAGPEIRLSDSQAPKKGKQMANRMIDGITIEVSDQAGQAIDKLTEQLADSKAEFEKVSKALTDEKVRAEKLAGELDAERAKAAEPVDVDALVAGRMALVEDAQKLAPKLETKGLNDHDIRKAAIVTVLDGFDLSDKSEEYVGAMFETLVKTHKPRESTKIADDLGKLNDSAGAGDKAREKMTQSRNAWRAK
jgi:hypothetical protein